jgi:hypothetical protein
MLPRARTHWRDFDRPFTRYCTSKPQPVSIDRATAFRVKQGKEQLVGEGQIIGHTKKCSGRIRPKQLMCRKVQIPHANAGSLDPKPKALVSNGII